MERSSSKKIAFYGVMAGLMFVFLLIETYLFSALFGNFTPAILTLPLAVALSKSSPPPIAETIGGNNKNL